VLTFRVDYVGAIRRSLVRAPVVTTAIGQVFRPNVEPGGQRRGASITVILERRRCQRPQRLRRIKRTLPGQVFFGA